MSLDFSRRRADRNENGLALDSSARGYVDATFKVTLIRVTTSQYCALIVTLGGFYQFSTFTPMPENSCIQTEVRPVRLYHDNRYVASEHCRTNAASICGQQRLVLKQIASKHLARARVIKNTYRLEHQFIIIHALQCMPLARHVSFCLPSVRCDTRDAATTELPRSDL